MTASLRASATFALVAPLRLAKRMPHAFNHVDTRVSKVCALTDAVRPERSRMVQIVSKTSVFETG